MEYFDYSAFQDGAEDSGERSTHQQQPFAQTSNVSLERQSNPPYYGPNATHQISCEIKPRLTKDQHDVLETHFKTQPKPNTNVKKNFAESLGVSLDKVNVSKNDMNFGIATKTSFQNWFQNRRAKFKQDAKKAQLNLYPQATNFSSDSESSPFQTSPQYAEIMKQWTGEEQMSNGLGISEMQHIQDQSQLGGLPVNNAVNTDQLQNFIWPQQPIQDMYDSPLDFNRRTITQEQFTEMERNGGMTNSSGDFESFTATFYGNQGAISQVFPDSQLKQNVIAFPYPVDAQLSSNDSTVPSTVSEQSLQVFPSSTIRQASNASSSEWADSRSSSLSEAQYANGTFQMAAQQHPPSAGTTSQMWQPGSSKPLDVNVLKGQFQQAAEARASLEQQHMHEQPLAWPDEAYVRRGSQTSLLAHSMGNVGINTPQQHQPGVFKSPAPLANIAARRQRPKPANLGLASLRSQSYGGGGQPGSPGHGQQPHTVGAGQSIRRIMSQTNVLNGGVAQGRVMKSTPGSAQRSPLNWNFADALNSPNLVRALSHGNLAPPTPMSPSRPEQMGQSSSYQTVPGHAVRQPSINEPDLEHGLPYQPPVSVPPHVSPPHTPMYYQQQFIPQRVGSSVIMENTPPQSAPASQSCFPTNIWAAPQPHAQQQSSQPQSQVPTQHQMQVGPMAQQPYMNGMISDQQFQMANVTFAPSQHANVVSSGPPPGVPLTFATGVPVVNADGQVQMQFQQQMQQMYNQPQQTPSPPQVPYAFGTSAGVHPGMQATAQPPKQASQPASDFIVHEYTPPDAIKRAATPRKTIDTGPKNYTFSNAGPEQYEEKKLKKVDTKDSTSSPASSNGASSTSTL